MKVFGRRKARALAAGTVSPEAVFTDPAPDAPDGPPTESDGTPFEVPPDGLAPEPVAGNGSRPDVGRDGADPITAPVPIVSGAPPDGEGAGSPKLRFGFSDTGDGTGEAAASAVAASAGVEPTGLPGPTRATTVTSLPAVGDGSVATATAPRKVISIGFGDELDEIETTSIDPSPVDLTRPGVDPRLRARRVQVRRDEGRKRLRWAFVGGVAAALLVAAGLVLESPLFAVDDVQVTGAAYTDPTRLQQVVDDLKGSTLLGADLGKAEATLAADPWVKRVRVERRPLRGVRIEIVERVPVATYMGTDQRWRVLDADGRVMAVLDPPGSKPVDPLEVVLPAPGPDLEAGATVPAALGAAASVVPRVPADLRARTCSLDVGDDARLQLTMCDGFVIALGSAERLRDKLVTTIYVLNTRVEDVAASSSLDVGDPEHPVLIPK